MMESNAVSSLIESKLPSVLVQKLTIGEKIFADGREVGFSVFEESSGTHKFFVFSSDGDTNSLSRKKKIGLRITKRNISHQKNEGRYLHQCSLCSFSSYKKYRFDRHQLVHSDAKPFACQLCSYKAKRSEHLESHVLFRHKFFVFPSGIDTNSSLSRKKKISSRKKKKKNLRKCSMCRFKSYKKSEFDIHQRVHSGVKPFACPSCSYKAKRSDHLKKHVVRHSSSFLLECPECNFKAINITSYKEHMLEHPSKKKFDFGKGVSVHSKGKPLACPLCSYKAKRGDKLKRHVLRHSSSFSSLLECPECNFKTINVTWYKEHILEHSSEKKFDFGEGYSKNQKNDVDNMSNTQDNTKLFKCLKCDFEAKSKRSMNQHMSQKHTDVQQI